MKPLSLKLKGFKGVNKHGIGCGEVFIDFTKLPNGLIALTGDNGMGKSTILDNMQPYLIMPYRAGKNYSDFSYYDNCFGSASKDLYFEMNGVTYRSLVLIDADKKKTEPYLYKKEDNNWIPIVDGKNAIYNMEIEKLLGPVKLFFTSIFRAQEAKTLSSHTKGEFKELFSQLLMLDDIEAKREIASEVRKYILALLSAHTGLYETLLKDITILEGNENDLKITEEQLTTNNNELVILKDDIEKHRTIITELNVQKTEQKAKRDQLSEINKQIEEKRKHITKLEIALGKKGDDVYNSITEHKDKIDKSTKLLDGKEKICCAVEKEEELKTELDAVTLNLQKTQEKYSTLEQDREKYTNLSIKIIQLEERVKKEKEDHTTQIESLEKEILNDGKVIDTLDKVPCADNEKLVSSCLFVQDAYTKKKDMSGKQHRMELLKNSPWSPPSEKELSAKKDELSIISDIEKQYREMTLKKKLLEEKREEFLKEIEKTREYTKLLPELEMAEETIKDAKAKILKLTAEIMEYREETNNEGQSLLSSIEALTQEKENIKIDDTLDSQIISKQKDLEKKIADRDILLGDKITLEKKLAVLNETIKRKEQLMEKKQTLDENIRILNNELSEWNLLEKILGKDGIVALEIDDAGPAITNHANALLSIFGSRFAIKITTTEPKANNKGVKEVFEIKVIDSQSDEIKSLNDLSGGERVWVETAIFQAINIRNKEISGKDFLTCFEDECDGKLSKQNKQRFFEMKRRNIDLGKFDQIFFISQDPDICNMSDAKIVLGNGTIRYDA